MSDIETQSISNANHESSILLELLVTNINLNDASVPQWGFNELFKGYIN